MLRDVFIGPQGVGEEVKVDVRANKVSESDTEDDRLHPVFYQQSMFF